jgi:hypothetical protein
MPFSNLNVVNTGKDGALDSTTTDEIDQMFVTLANRQRIVFHFHGGLVPKANGMAGASRLYQSCYEPTGAYPIFFVWESGFLETIRHNLAEIAGESFFKTLMRWVLKFAIAKLDPSLGTKAITTQLPYDTDVEKELACRNSNEEPFREVKAPPTPTELTDNERRTFEETLAEAEDFSNDVDAIVKYVLPAPSESGEKGVVTRAQTSTQTLMSPEVIDKLKADAALARAEGQKGILSTAQLVKSAGTILVRVIRRFVQHHDHGLYPTVMEEILRELYIANAGEAIWNAMKKETFDTFYNPPGAPIRGGWYFTRKLAALLRTGHRPEITLVGHSAGAVFIDNFLAQVDKLRQDAAEPLPADFAFKNLLLLAPACTFAHFEPTIANRRALFKNIRIFTMHDKEESNDVLVPHVYTRSLLYLISGILEKEVDGTSAFDMPVLGMERYYTAGSVYAQPEVVAAREFLSVSNRAEWSQTPEDAAPGLATRSTSHGGFDSDASTLASLAYIITR